MPKYIVKDETGALHVIGAEGFVPEGVMCEAPQDAESDDGDAIDLETYQDEMGLERVRAVVSVSKKLAKQKLRDAAKAASKTKDDARLAKVDAIKPLKGKSLTAAQMKQVCEFFLEILFDENSSLAAELVRLAAASKTK